jgi:hypothetical protein
MAGTITREPLASQKEPPKFFLSTHYWAPVLPELEMKREVGMKKFTWDKIKSLEKSKFLKLKIKKLKSRVKI